jgi:outer membrane protein assembly factor BamB
MKFHRDVLRHALLVLAAVLLVGSICNKPPAIPDKPTGPNMAQMNGVAIYSTKTTDPSGGDVRYQFGWGDGTTSSWGEFVRQDSVISDTHAFVRSGLLAVRARAQNLKNATSGWSDTLRVAVSGGETTLKWVYAYLDENFDSTPFSGTVAASSAGYLYAVSELGLLHAVTQEGARRSTYQTIEQDEFTNSPMVGPDDIVWVACSDTTLYGIRVNGTRAYSIPLRDEVLSNMAISTDWRIYFNCESDSAYCVDTLGRRWAAYTGGGPSSPVLTADNALVIVGGGDGLIHAFNTADGETAWTWTTGGPVNSSAAIGSDGTIYIGSDDGSLYAMKPDGGAPLWQYPANSPVTTSPVLDAAGIIYFTSDNGVVHAVNTATHSAFWTYSLSSDGSSTGALSQNGVLFVKALYSAEDSLVALNTSDGTNRWSAALPSGSELEIVCAPLIDQYGTIYVTTGTGIYAFWGQSLPAVSSWPMFQHDPQRTGKAQ